MFTVDVKQQNNNIHIGIEEICGWLLGGGSKDILAQNVLAPKLYGAPLPTPMNFSDRYCLKKLCDC